MMEEDQEYKYGVPIKRVSWLRREGDFKLPKFIDENMLIEIDLDYCRAEEIYIPEAGYIQYKIGMFLENKYWEVVRYLHKLGAFPDLEPGTMFSWIYFKPANIFKRHKVLWG